MKSNPLKWHGGKRYLAQWIIAYFPRHTHYVEPYFGGGAVLFAKPDRLVIDHSEVVNDINGQLVNFWRCVRNEYKMKELIVELGLTPVSSHVFQKHLSGAKDSIENPRRPRCQTAIHSIPPVSTGHRKRVWHTQ